MDRWDGRRFARPFRIDGEAGAVRFGRVPKTATLAVEVAGPGSSPGVLRRRLEAMFVDEQAAVAELAGRDPVIAGLHRRYPGIFPVLYLDPLGALLAMVTAQQVNLAFALSVRRAILGRLGRRIPLGDDFVLAPDPERMARATDETWRSLRLTAAKGRCLRALGRAICSGALSFAALERASASEALGLLTELPGIGPWTASQYLNRVLGRPVVVAGDLGVRKAVQLAYGLALLPSASDVLGMTADYGPASFTAQYLLLFHLSQQRPGWPPPSAGASLLPSSQRQVEIADASGPAPPGAVGRRARPPRRPAL